MRLANTRRLRIAAGAFLCFCLGSEAMAQTVQPKATQSPPTQAAPSQPSPSQAWVVVCVGTVRRGSIVAPAVRFALIIGDRHC
jgi:hypothetical protein